MLNKTIKFCEIIIVGVALFVAVPFTLYAYNASVTTENATNITPTNATFNGYVNTGGVYGSAWFEYGTDTNFGSSTSLNAYNFNNAYSGSYTTNISGLTANTTYYFRAVALNASGEVYGNVESFTTTFSTSGYNNSMSPTAITTSGEVLASNTAQFNALILLGDTSKTNTWFEWGTTPDLGNATATVPISGAPAIKYVNTITGLNPGTAYYFRAVAQNAYGISDGAVLSLVSSGAATSGSVIKNTTNSPAKITSTNTTSTTSPANQGENGISSTSALGASVFGSGSFLPVNLFGWLILLILLLVLILLGKHLYRGFSQKKFSQ